MKTPTKSDEERDCYVEFVGGPYDGHIADSNDPVERALARFVCFITDGGQKGRSFCGQSPASIAGSVRKMEGSPFHTYKVIESELVNGRMRIRAEWAKPA